MSLEIRIISTKKGNACPVLCVVNGEYVKYLSFDLALMSRLSCLSVRDIEGMKQGDSIVIMC